MSSDNLWYVRSHGKAIGPFPTEKLARWWSRGDFGDDTLVCRQDESDWVRLDQTEIPEFAAPTKPNGASATTSGNRREPASPPPIM